MFNSFTDIWKPPFRCDEYGYVWDVNNVMTFTIYNFTGGDYNAKQKFCENLVAALNGKECEKYDELEIKDGCDVYRNGKIIGCFRGWGHLRGSLNIDADNAAKIQDELVAYCIGRMAK